MSVRANFYHTKYCFGYNFIKYRVDKFKTSELKMLTKLLTRKEGISRGWGAWSMMQEITAYSGARLSLESFWLSCLRQPSFPGGLVLHAPPSARLTEIGSPTSTLCNVIACQYNINFFNFCKVYLTFLIFYRRITLY